MSRLPTLSAYEGYKQHVAATNNSTSSAPSAFERASAFTPVSQNAHSHSSSNVEDTFARDWIEYYQGLLTSAGVENDANRAYNAEQAEINRAWLEKMSNTSYQRAVEDMKKAGLNPILAFQQGGASVPNSSSASYNVGGGDTFSTFLNAYASLISSASDVLRVFLK